jgi:hypothetical protein
MEALGGRAAKNWPFTAIRLENGNTLVCLTNGNKVVEMDAKGNVVWKVSNADLPGDPIDDACGGQRLANGNTVITAYHAKKGVKLLEVTPEKKNRVDFRGAIPGAPLPNLDDQRKSTGRGSPAVNHS